MGEPVSGGGRGQEAREIQTFLESGGGGKGRAEGGKNRQNPFLKRLKNNHAEWGGWSVQIETEAFQMEIGGGHKKKTAKG